MKKTTSGFTIVELLIVIVVIAILATISIVAYTGIRNNAYNSTVASDAANIARRLEVYKAENERYPRTVTEFPSNLKISRSAYHTQSNNLLYCLNGTTDQYGLVLGAKSGRVYLVNSGNITIANETFNSSSTVACSQVGGSWSNTPPNAAIHGFHPTSTVSTYVDGWLSTWPLTNG